MGLFPGMFPHTRNLSWLYGANKLNIQMWTYKMGLNILRPRAVARMSVTSHTCANRAPNSVNNNSYQHPLGKRMLPFISSL